MIKSYLTKKFSLAPIVALLLLMGMLFLLFAPSNPTSYPQQQDSGFADSSSIKKMPEFQTGSYLVRVVWGTALVLLVIFLGAHFYRKYANFSQDANRSSFRILSRKSIGPKQSLLLINVEGHKLLLGLTEQNVTLICDYGVSEPGGVEYEAAQQPQPKFLTILKRFRGDADV